MADRQIFELDAAVSIALTDVIPNQVSDGAIEAKKATWQQVSDLIKPYSYETLAADGTNSGTATLITKIYTDVVAGTGSYIKLPLTPTIGDKVYVSNVDPTLNLFIVRGGVNDYIYTAGFQINSGVGQFNIGTNTGLVYCFEYTDTNRWYLYMSPSYIPVKKTYKVYTAIINQTGTANPIATVLENELGGTVVWSRNGVGDYFATLASVFTANKTIAFVNSVAGRFITARPFNTSDFGVSQLDTTFAVIDDISDMPIEIRVYN